MTNNDTLGMLCLGSDLGNGGTGGGGSDDSVLGQVLLHHSDHLMLLLQVLSAVLLNEVNTGESLSGIGGDLNLVPDLLAVVDDAVLYVGVDGALDVGKSALLGSLGTNVDVYVQALESEVCSEAAADGASAIHGNGLNVFYIHA